MKRITSCMLLLVLIFSTIGVNATTPDATKLKSKAVVLIEQKTGKVLFEKNKDEGLPMASITKLMLLLITMEEIDSGKIKLDDTVVGSPKAKAAGGSTIFLDVGEKMTVDDILKGICINSANDAAIAMAETLAGSENEFVDLMNKKAVELGLKNTHYVNVTGFDADNHYSSAYDIAILSKEIVTKHPRILEYSQIRETWLRGKKTQLLNTNKLLSRYQYATGLKTGTETKALNCLSATASKDGMDLIAVVLGSPDADTRFSEAKELLEYGYDNFEITTPIKASEDVGTIPVVKGSIENAKVVVQNELTIIVPKTYSDKIKKDIVMDKNIVAPAKAGTKIGEMTISVAGEKGDVVPVVLEEDIVKITFWQAFAKIFKSIFKI